MLELILGPMYSGKTTTLLTRRAGRTLVINHEFDTRAEGVKTHDGVEAAALKCRMIPTINNYDTVLIDEAQFFESLEGAEDLAPNVVVAGLSGDYMRRPFGRILDLIPKADKVTFLKATCSCGNPASFTKRLSDNKHLINVHAHYVPVCEKCY